MQTKTDFCFTCEQDQEFRREVVNKAIEVRGRVVEHDFPEWVCTKCGERFADESAGDPLILVYNKVRDEENLLSPAEIEGIRNKWGLSQEVFASLLGMGQPTISRYENGALQDLRNDWAIRSCEDRVGMQRLYEFRGHRLDAAARESLERKLARFVEVVEPAVPDPAADKTYEYEMGPANA